MSGKLLDFSFKTEVSNKLRTLGVDAGLLFGEKREYDLMEAVQDFKTISPYFKTKLVSKRKQLNLAAKLLDTPLEAQGIHVVSSFPNDTRAKIFALHAFRNAYMDSISVTRKPRWVTLYGDKLDYERVRNHRPNFLVITNVVVDSTQYKMERLRDLLSMFSDIPRVVVTGGTIDPTEMFNNRLFLECDSALSIGPENVVTNLLELIIGGAN
ncbi:DNA polymerase [Dickeya phage vB_DsoM_JA29]|uniref:Uncharacterized protein n=1 Tax=Dickeya phage vB_DsoM_JA29 TaxID=2283031 RepID=A0A384ZX92_9CAUD|nr:DNA polymerase [Dickeya phage vB_DsoM_JA29]AXG66880.1 hypothetical protein JA29_154 [Dickeya phage vB_DsoM_JA29]